MKRKNSGYIQNVDRLIEETPVDLVLARYGMQGPNKDSSEHRMTCPFDPSCSESQYGNLTIKLNDPAKLIYCHSCEVRGNLLTLIHGLETNRPPTTGRLRGQEFKDACKVLLECNKRSVGEPVANSPVAGQATVQKTESLPVQEPAKEPKKNTPLGRHENEKVRELANLYEDLIVDVESMPPEAASYFRARPWLTPDVCQKWGIGYLPKNGRSMFRSWIVYTHRNQRGEVLSYSGRDPNFDRKWNKWIRDGRPESKKPMKHKYVKGFMKGSELFGQQVSRLGDKQLAESASNNGLFVVEGMNDVVKLDTLGIASVGICSNRATDTQVEMIAKFANRISGGRVVLLPDCDEEGENGFKELMWRLAEQDVDTKLGWSRKALDLKGETIQPESIDKSRLAFVMERISKTRS